MKVVHIIIGLNVGGAELMLKRLVLHSQAKGEFRHEVISLTDLGVIGQQLEAQGIPVYALGMTSVLSLPIVYFKLKKLLKKIKPDVVQTWMYHADFIGGLAAKSIGVKNIVWNVRNTNLYGRGAFAAVIAKLCIKMSYTLPKSIIYVSRSALASHEKLGYNSKISCVICNGFDIEKFQYDPVQREIYRKKLNICDDDMVIGSIGRYSDSKDHKTFIKSICLSAKFNTSIKGLLIGRDIDLDSFEITESEKKNFIVLGQLSDIHNLLSSIDIFCLHSKTEGFPNVLGEAMSTSLPCVVTRAGDAELILDEPQYTFDVGDAKGISEALLRLSNIDSLERVRIGKLNRLRIVENFKLSLIVNQYETLYTSVINK